MTVTIKTKLFGLMIGSLLFVACVSAAGYWGIQTVEKATVELDATSSAIQNHIEAAMYNDLTRSDISSIFVQKGDNQQERVAEFTEHCKLLRERIARAQSFAVDPESRTLLAEDGRLVDQYVAAGEAMVDAILHDPGQAGSRLGPYLDLYKGLREKLASTGAQLAESVRIAESRSRTKGAWAARAMFAICAISMFFLSLGSFTLVRQISQSLHRLRQMIENIAEGEGDVSKRLEVAGSFKNDELGEVSRLFNLFMDKLQGILRGVAAQTHKLATASRQVLEASEQITASSHDTAAQSSAAARVTQQVTHNLEGLTTGAGEMTLTIKNIALNANDAAKVAVSAVNAAQAADTTIAKLDESSSEIGMVIKVITSIAQKTNLLALNATIEAARAGEAGKGFAVVANEVKELAKQTASATEDISRKIKDIQGNTRSAVEAIATVSEVIHQINSISGSIAAAVEEQSATTNEMTRNTHEAAQGAGDIYSNIGGVEQAANDSLLRAQESQKAAQDMAAIAEQLADLMHQFKIERADPRFDVSLPVKIAGVDPAGQPVAQDVTAINISRQGALLAGVSIKLVEDSEVELIRGNRQARFQIAWVGEDNTSRARQIGVSALDSASSFWNDVLEHRAGSGSQSPESATRQSRAKAKAQGA